MEPSLSEMIVFLVLKIIILIIFDIFRIPRHDVMYAVEKTLVNLLHKSSDMVRRI